jgi:hypothetical protein
MSDEPLVKVNVPAPIVAEGLLPGMRHVGGQAYVEATRHQASEWLRRSKAWRDLNQELARELGIEDA